MDSIGAGIIAGTTGYRRATEAFSETATLEAYLKFERALAEVQGALGIIPKGSADKLVALCQLEAIDRAALRLGVARVGYKIDGQISWRYAFNAGAPVLPGFESHAAFTL